ncbi:NlpC/P60 family protein [Streptomyces sp. NPDC097619]|uniref:C40 family peptidase n=1 Tax=Streptomyces sp. NPDC097619 TaxID=3157228 RepID=UPI00333425F4
MSHTAHIPSHRKPRRSASKLAVRAGVAGGVLSTLALAGPASAAPSEPVTETLEMPVLDLDLAAAHVATALTQSADAAKARALDTELTAQQQSAEKSAATTAKKSKQAAVQKAEEEKVAKAEAQAEAEAEAQRAAVAERASRSASRTSLGNGNGSSSSSADEGTVSDGGSSSKSKASSSSASQIVNFALAQVGKSYVRGATGPSAYDCSGLVQAAYRQVGITLDRMSQDQSNAGRSVSLSNLQPGDIVYWGGKGSAYHVGIYVGGGEFVGAQNPSTGVVKRSMDWDRPSGAVRVL